jgi:hypothetical protein
MCKICESPLKLEIEKKDSAWKADQTIKWARGKGIRINRTILARHRANHMNNDYALPDHQSVMPHPDAKARSGNKRRIAPAGEVAGDIEFLDAVTDKVHEKLRAGEFDLKIESAFKAIELKHKISDESRNEKLLLEILSEIRADELARSEKRLMTST